MKTILSTATGSHAQGWYEAYRVVNSGTSTDFYFTDDPHPAPLWKDVPDSFPVQRKLVFDPWTLVSREIALYDPDGIVSLGAQRAWLRSKARRRAKAAAAR
jgi:hypothetical protein